MLTTVFLSKVFGFFLLIIGLFLLTKQKFIKSVVEEISQQRSALFILAVVNTFLGVFIVSGHNYWVMAWPVVVTIIGWLILIGGVVRLFHPDCVVKMAKCIAKSAVYFYVIGIIDVLVGAYLIHHVYFVHYSHAW